MTNYAFQGVDGLLKSTSALAVHLHNRRRFLAKAESVVRASPQPKGVGLVICRFCHVFKSFNLIQKISIK